MIFCIGNGPSLTGFNFKKLNFYPTIGCNHIIYHYPEVDSMVALDEKFCKENHEQINKFCGIKYIHTRAIVPEIDFKNLIPIESHYKQPFINNPYLGEKVYLGYMSGITALNIAIEMRYYLYPNRNIYLLGHDLYGNYFYPRPEAEEYIERNKDLDKIAATYNRFIPLCDSLGIKVYNCSKDSRIKSFEYINIEDAFKKDL